MGHDYSSSTYASSKYLPCPYLTSLGYFACLNPIPPCWLSRGRRVPRRWLQLQCCIHDAGLLCCSLSLRSWLKPGTGKDTEKWLLQTAVTAFSLEHLRIPYLCPFSLLYHPTAVWNGETVLHSSGMLQVVGKHWLTTRCDEEQGCNDTALYFLVLSRLGGVFA